MRLLDIATGTGDPALTLAGRVAPGGRVTCTDLSPGMLVATRSNARELGLDNVDFVVAGGDALPFLDDSFDGVSCRFGIMFIPDTRAALREMQRVLVPGGRIALVAWGRDDQPFYDDTRGILLRHWKVIPPVRQPYTPFRFAAADSLAPAMREAGFDAVEQRLLKAPWPAGTAAARFDFFYEQWKGEFDKMPRETAERVQTEIRERLRSREVDGELAYTVEVWLATGVKPA
jgi:ubiquinone/menaquinone biosynthesis C-methylase UbiE